MKHMEVWVDSDLCTGCGHCIDYAPEVFTHVDGVSFVKMGGVVLGEFEVAIVPTGMEDAVTAAALDCPGEIIFTDMVEE